MKTVNLYAPPDTLESNAAWSATCGPMAIAAILRRPVAAVRDLFPGFPERPWVTPTVMQAAFIHSGTNWRHGPAGLPMYGLAWLQVGGPWEGPGVPPGAAYRYTHWIAAAEANGRTLVYDGNAAEWMAYHDWQRDVMAAIVAGHKRATGWRVRKAWEMIE